MKNFSILSRSVKVECSLTAEQWQLYTYSMKCGNAARALNAAVKRAARTEGTKPGFYREVEKVMCKYSKYGAYDSEPTWVLDEIADEIYGEGGW